MAAVEQSRAAEGGRDRGNLSRESDPATSEAPLTYRASSTRLEIPSFSKMLKIEFFTVLSLIFSVRETSRLLIPSATNREISSSRGLSRALLLISGLHEAARFKTIGATPEQFVDGVVEGLRDLAVDVRVLASLKSEFVVRVSPLLHQAILARKKLEDQVRVEARKAFVDADTAQGWHSATISSPDSMRSSRVAPGPFAEIEKFSRPG